MKKPNERLRQHIQPTAWVISALPDDLRYVSALCLPEPVIGYLRRLRDPDHHLPYVSLHDLLNASSSEIIGFNRALWYDHAGPETPWLYTFNAQLNVDRLKNLILAWVRCIYDDSEVKAARSVWEGANWVWKTIDLQTAAPALRRQLLPGLLARRLLAKNHGLLLNGTQYDLRMVAGTALAGSSELMTEPIHYQYLEDGDAEKYSLVSRFSVINQPEDHLIAVAHRLMVRRWQLKPIFVKQARSGSVYLRWSPSYLDTVPRSDVFGQIRMRYSYNARSMIWVGHQSKIFDFLSTSNQLPDADEFKNNPRAYQEMLLSPSVSASYQGKVASGMHHNDHYEAFSHLTAQFAGFAEPFPAARRVDSGDNHKRTPTYFAKKSTTGRQGEHAGPVRIDLHTNHAEELEQYLCAALSDKPESLEMIREGSTLRIVGNDSLPEIEIVRCADETMTALLEDTGRPKKPPTPENQKKRMDAIVRMYPKTDMPIGALIGLPRYDRLAETKHRDPKDAIRYGLSRTGRVSQFFVPEIANENDKQRGPRLQNTAADLLRSLGFRTQPFYVPRAGANLPPDVDILAFWILQLNRRNHDAKTVMLPIFVEAAANDMHMRVFLPREDGSAVCYPNLRQALCAVHEISDFLKEPGDVIRFFSDALMNRQRHRPAVLILHEQNLRRIFEELSDQRHENVTLRGLLADDPEIRVARLAFSKHDEAPMCVPGQPRSKYQGLYGHPEQASIFYSLHNVGDRKVTSDHRKGERVNESFVNPSTVQIRMSNLHTGDDAAAWAGVVHQLRKASNHISVPTLLPQPLHDLGIFADYLEQHVIAVDDEVEDEE